MKLLTHNHLVCIYKECRSAAALTIEAELVTQVEMDPKFAFVAHIFKVVNYDILRTAATQSGLTLPPRSKLPPMELAIKNESLLRSLQRVLLQTNVKEGFLKCEECGTRYRIQDGVVNMKECIRGLRVKTAEDSIEEVEETEEVKSDDTPMKSAMDATMAEASADTSSVRMSDAQLLDFMDEAADASDEDEGFAAMSSAS